ncbi:hypothetical protein BDZ89DRAFT_1076068 [Hymenopellis radicata]|nr:hypothetical protein BDZ89DRAFT_1076068 [Hymenopellis radicata]
METGRRLMSVPSDGNYTAINALIRPSTSLKLANLPTQNSSSRQFSSAPKKQQACADDRPRVYIYPYLLFHSRVLISKMPLTELITLVHATPSSFLSLSSFYRTWWTRQSSRSAYPFTFYTDVTSPSVVYLISGWHSSEEYAECVVTIDAMEEDSDGDGVWAFPGMERSLGVRWTGCGEDVRSPSTLYRFTMYDVSVTGESILGRHQRDAVMLMRRVGIPAASSVDG